MRRAHKYCAFTLAEVLITLAIIGVVAAITLPTLINNIQDRQNIAKWKKEYSVINNAFQLVINDGIDICASYNNRGECVFLDGGGKVYSEEFLEAFKQKLKVIDSCNESANNYTCDYSKDKDPKQIKYKWGGNFKYFLTI